MDHRCPLCGRDLAARKISQAIIAQMEIDCPHCKRRIQVNLHRAEVIVILASFGGFALLAALAYWLERQGLFALAVGAAMAGAVTLPLIERTWLRSWRRYVVREAPAVGNSGP